MARQASRRHRGRCPLRRGRPRRRRVRRQIRKSLFPSRVRCAPVPAPGTPGPNLSTRSPCFGQTSLAVCGLDKAFRAEGFPRRKACSPPDAGDIGLSKGPPMQSTPTLKDTDPHDVFAIETLLHAHAEKAPPLAHDPAAAPQVHIAPPISVSAPVPQIEPTFRDPDVRDIQFENVRPSDIKVDGLKPPGEQPMGKWAKRVIIAAARPVRRHGRCGLAALWRSGQGDGRRVGAALRAGCIAFGGQACRRRSKPSPSTTEAAATDQAAPQPASSSSTGSNPPPLPRLLLQRNRPSCNRWRRISPRWAGRSRN